MKYGEIIRKTMQAEGYCTKEVAEKICVCRSHLAGIITGVRLPSYAVHRRICDLLALDETFYSVSEDVQFAPRLSFKATDSCRQVKHGKAE